MTRSPALLLLLLGALPSAEAARGESWRPVQRSGLCSAAPFPPALNLATQCPPGTLLPSLSTPSQRFPTPILHLKYCQFYMPLLHSWGYLVTIRYPQLTLWLTPHLKGPRII